MLPTCVDDAAVDPLQAGVSTDINASFVRPGGKLGDTIFMECNVIGIGTQRGFETLWLKAGQAGIWHIREPISQIYLVN